MPSSSLFLRASALLSALSSTALATNYQLGDKYEGETFLDGFNFFTADDPTNGYVDYVDRTTAKNKGMTSLIGTDNYIGVDYTTPLKFGVGPRGRASVRIESTKTYNHGLFVVDLKHMPGGICGTWPAFWSLGSGDWPKHGEIDIIEGVNRNTQNKQVLHTDTNCSVNGLGQTGAEGLYNCALDSASGASGCDVNSVAANTFGTGFNDNNGGVYAMEWTSEAIKMWFFPRGKIPASITADSPDTTEFGIPVANFAGACDIDSRFIDHRFIFDNTFCGDWAGWAYSNDPTCKAYPNLNSQDQCKTFVAENPTAFKDAYWQISYFKTYTKKTVVSSSSYVASSTSSSTSSVSSSTSSAYSITSTSSSASSSSSSSSSSYSSSISSTSSLSSSSASSVSSSTSSQAYSTTSTLSSSVTSTSSSYSSTVSSTSSPASSSASSSTSSSLSSSSSSSSSSINSQSSAVSSSASSSATSSVYSSISSVSSPTSSSTISYPTGTSSPSLSASTSVYPYSYSSSSSTSCTSSYSTSITVIPYGHSSSSSTSCTKSTSTASQGSTSSTSYPASSSAYDYGHSSATSSSSYGKSSSTSCTKSDSSSTGANYPTSSGGYYASSVSSSAYVHGHSSSTSCTKSKSSSASISSYGHEQYPATYSHPASSTPVNTPSGYPYPHASSSSVSSFSAETYTTHYVDVCSTGYTTISTTLTVTYPVITPTGHGHAYPATTPVETYPAGFTTTTKYCPSGCGSYPTIVTVTIPITYTQTQSAAYDGHEHAHSHAHEHKPTGPIKPYYSNSPLNSIYNNTAAAYPTASIQTTKVVTLSVYAVPSASYTAAAYSGKGANNTETRYPVYSVPYGTGKPTGTGSYVKPTQSKTSEVPYFTGAASGVRVGGMMAGIFALGALFL